MIYSERVKIGCEADFANEQNDFSFYEVQFNGQAPVISQTDQQADCLEIRHIETN